MVFAVEQETGQSLAQLGFAHAGGAEEQKAAVRFVGVGQPGAGTADGIGHGAHGFVLANHALVQHVFDFQQFIAFAFHHFGHRNAGHARHDFGDFVGGYLGAQQLVAAFRAGLAFGCLKLGFQLGQFFVLQPRQIFPAAFALQGGHFDFELVDLLFNPGAALGDGFFCFPDFVQIGKFFFQFGDFAFNQIEAFFAGVVFFFAQGFAFDFKLD